MTEAKQALISQIDDHASQKTQLETNLDTLQDQLSDVNERLCASEEKEKLKDDFESNYEKKIIHLES